MSLIHGNETNFKELINDELVIVDFFATWCGPCRMLGPVLEEISSTYKVVKIDVDESSSLAREYKIMSVPTIIKFKNGIEIDKIMGFLPKEALIEWIEKK